MMRYRLDLKADECLMLTPSGAYHAACTEQPERVRRLLFLLMEAERAPGAQPADIESWAARLEMTAEDVIGLLYSLQSLKFIEALAPPLFAPRGPLEKMLPPLLNLLSSSGRALLSDRQGLYIANVGFAHETAEELSALGADLAALHARHRYLVNRNLGLRAEAWGLLGADGGSRIGFWSLRIGETEFNLVIADVPYLNRSAFRDLVWALSCRYGKER